VWLDDAERCAAALLGLLAERRQNDVARSDRDRQQEQQERRKHDELGTTVLCKSGLRYAGLDSPPSSDYM
jgi:hypothetical protein